MSTWRVLINPKLWDQEEFIRKYNAFPEDSFLSQSKGRCAMRSLPKAGDTILFVIKGRVVMKGLMESDGFITGTAHRVHSCNRGPIRSHTDVPEFALVKILTTGLDDPIEWKGQRTWAKVS
jgi:hypothetical protein